MQAIETLLRAAMENNYIETGLIGIVAALMVQGTKKYLGMQGLIVRALAVVATVALSLFYVYAFETPDTAHLAQAVLRGVVAWLVATGAWSNTRPAPAGP